MTEVNFNKFKDFCFICGESILDEDRIIKKHETYGGYVKICYDCLNVPIKCLKGNITLAELIHRVKNLREI